MLLQAVEKLLPSGVLPLGAGQRVEMSGLDLVDEFEGLALGRDEVVPAAGDHEILGQTEHSVGDRIAMVMVVKKPRVDVALAQSVLNGLEIHRQGIILHEGERAASRPVESITTTAVVARLW